MSNYQHQITEELLNLSHTLGSPQFDWAILGEGNASAAISSEQFVVKASGSQLATLTEKQIAIVRFAPILEALNSNGTYTDQDVKGLLNAATVPPGELVPSVETMLHAYLLTLPNIRFVGHTHVTSINGLLCSESGWNALSNGTRLFPDEIVVCGVAPCCVPYVDPGLPLARVLRIKVNEFIERYSRLPKTIYLQNHGFIALAATSKEVVSITQMADKAARILTAALSAGRPTFLTDEQVQRIATRPDEHQRQKALGLKSDQS